MAVHVFTAGPDALDLQGTDDALIDYVENFGPDDSVINATGPTNILSYTDSNSWSISLDSSFAGINGFEILSIATEAGALITLTDDFVARNSDSAGVLTLDTSLSGSLWLDGSAMLGSYGLAIIGGAADDSIVSGAGRDLIAPGFGADLAQAGDGDDTIRYSDADHTYNDTIDAGLGNDVLELATANAWDLRYFTGLAGLETVRLSAGNDLLIIDPTQMADITTLDGSTGLDELVWSNGDLSLLSLGIQQIERLTYTGTTTATLSLSADISGLASIDSASSGILNVTSQSANFDVSQITLGTIGTLSSEDEGDTNIRLAGSALPQISVISDAGGATDTLISTDGTLDLSDTTLFGIERLAGTGATIFTLDGNDWAGLTAIYGGGTLPDGSNPISDIDRILLTNDPTDGVILYNLSPLTIVGIEVIQHIASERVNIVLPETTGLQCQANGGDDTLTSGSGSDSLFGFDGNDILDAGTVGNDQLIGGLGDDLLLGSAGENRLFGEEGADSLSGDLGNDTLTGGADADVLFGNAGNDMIFAGPEGDGGDGIDGGSGNDTLIANNAGLIGDTMVGGAGDDMLFGGLADDLLIDDSGNDQLLGGDGNDLLLCGVGNDTMWGDGGADIFAVTVNDGRDVVVDFTEGLDVLNLSLLGYDNFAALQAAITTETASNGVIIHFGAGWTISVIGMTGLDANDCVFTLLTQPGPLPDPLMA